MIAPTLPEGYFFRVIKGNGWLYEIQLRRRLWKYSYKIDASFTDLHCSIEDKMQGLKDRHFWDYNDTGSAYGEYPPKTTIGGA